MQSWQAAYREIDEAVYTRDLAIIRQYLDAGMPSRIPGRSLVSMAVALESWFPAFLKELLHRDVTPNRDEILYAVGRISYHQIRPFLDRAGPLKWSEYRDNTRDMPGIAVSRLLERMNLAPTEQQEALELLSRREDQAVYAVPLLVRRYSYSRELIQMALDRLLAATHWYRSYPSTIPLLLQRGAQLRPEHIRRARREQYGQPILLYVGVGPVAAALRVVLGPDLVRYLARGY